jgi:hypothetical protein
MPNLQGFLALFLFSARQLALDSLATEIAPLWQLSSPVVVEAREA